MCKDVRHTEPRDVAVVSGHRWMAGVSLLPTDPDLNTQAATADRITVSV